MTARPLSDDLYVLKFLAGEDNNSDYTDCEYRLLCSGLLSSAGAELKSASSRFLLSEPFKWIVASDEWDRYPTNVWPLETVILFRSRGMQRHVGPAQHYYPPDDELAHDLAALLTLINRRLITVAGSSSKTSPAMKPEFSSIVLQTPLMTRMSLKFWQRQPHVIHRRPSDQEAVAVDYNPNPKAIDGGKISEFLRYLPRLKAAKSIVLAARLYAQAMALVHQEPDMAYLLITMAIESVASQAIDGTKTDEEIGASISAEFRACMKRLGANEQQIREAMILAVPSRGRPTFQFRAFAEQYQSEYLYAEDDLFRTGSIKQWLPNNETVKAAAKAIYNQRSKFVHEGQPYPASIALGLGARVDSRAFQFDCKKGFEVPPLAWAERLAHVCIMNYWRKEAEAVGPHHPC